MGHICLQVDVDVTHTTVNSISGLAGDKLRRAMRRTWLAVSHFGGSTMTWGISPKIRFIKSHSTLRWRFDKATGTREDSPSKSFPGVGKA